MEQSTLFDLLETDHSDFDEAAALARAKKREAFPLTAWTGWTFDAEGKPSEPTFTLDKVWWLNDYYRDSWEGQPASGDDTTRSRAWTEAAGNPVRFRLGVSVETGDLAVTDNKGENVYVLPLEEVREGLVKRRTRR